MISVGKKQRKRKIEAPINKPAQADTEETTHEMLIKKVYQWDKLINRSIGWECDL